MIGIDIPIHHSDLRRWFNFEWCIQVWMDVFN